MIIYYIGLMLVFIFNQRLNPAHDQTENRVLARSTIVSLGWPILIGVFFTLVVVLYICSFCDKLTEWLGDFLDEVT